MPALVLGVLLVAGAAAAVAFSRRDGAPTTSSSGGSAWARSRGTTTPTDTSTSTSTPTPEASAARICAQSADAVPLDSAELGAWADCPGRPIRDLRVLAARLERAAADETDVPRRTRLIDSHVALMDWISRREREAGRAA